MFKDLGMTFNELHNLYKTDPEEFDRLTKDLIEREIQKSPKQSQPRLRGMIWEINKKLEKCKNDFVRAEMCYNIMWDEWFKSQEKCLEKILTSKSCFKDTACEKIIKVDFKNKE